MNDTDLAPEVLETAQAQAAADAELMKQLQAKLGTVQLVAPNRAQRRGARHRANRTAIEKPLDSKGRRRIQRLARQLAGVR